MRARARVCVCNGRYKLILLILSTGSERFEVALKLRLSFFEKDPAKIAIFSNNIVPITILVCTLTIEYSKQFFIFYYC